MEQKKEKIRFRLNLFDAVVLLLALVVGGVFLWQSLDVNRNAVVAKNQVLRYQIIIKEASEGTGESIVIGSGLTDVVKNYDLGIIQSVEVLPTEKQVLNHMEKEYQTAHLEGFEDIIVDMEVSANNTESAIVVDGGLELRVGDLLYMRGAGYMAAGYVYSMERLD